MSARLSNVLMKNARQSSKNPSSTNTWRNATIPEHEELGCTVKRTRKDVGSHEESEDDHHLQVASELISQLTEKVDNLLNQIVSFNELEVNTLKPGDDIRYTIKDYSRNKKQKTVLTFKPFYSWSRGYKLQMKIYLDGITNRQEDSGYISMLFYLLKGAYDKELDWPFRPTVKVSILNHSNDKLSNERTLRCNTGLEEGIGWGYSQLISHTELEKVPTHYGIPPKRLIENDVVYLSIAIVKSKPWLICNI